MFVSGIHSCSLVPISNVSVCVRLVKYINTYLSEKDKTDKSLTPEYLDQLKVYTVHPEIQANTRPEVYQLFFLNFKQRKNCGTALKHYGKISHQKQTDMKLATITS